MNYGCSLADLRLQEQELRSAHELEEEARLGMEEHYTSLQVPPHTARAG